MGIVVQRQFTVAGTDRREFEQISREIIWARFMRFGAPIVAYGAWAFGGPGDVVVTHATYEDFDHWTATRPWGQFNTDPAWAEETKPWADDPRDRRPLIAHSSARIIDFDDALSEAAPRRRSPGDAVDKPPPTFGPRSIVAETRAPLRSDDVQAWRDALADRLWPALREAGARVIVVGHDPLSDEQVILTAYRSISQWHELASLRRDGAPSVDGEATRLLMVQTNFGTPL